MHTMINALDEVPSLVKFSSAARDDHVFLQELDLEKGSFVVFDKGYLDYQQYEQWSLNDIFFVTRQKKNALYTSKKEFDIDEKTDSGILKDEQIELIKKDGKPFRLRRIAYWHERHINPALIVWEYRTSVGKLIPGLTIFKELFT